MQNMIRPLLAPLAAIIAILVSGLGGDRSFIAHAQNWENLPNIAMSGGLKVFWNVKGDIGVDSRQQAYMHGFLPLTIFNIYTDYPGEQKHNIYTFLGQNNKNPWAKPDYFEHIIRRNIEMRKSSGTYVLDIEFGFEEDAAKAWADPVVRAASGQTDFNDFEKAYFREWASWFALPASWTKQRYPKTMVGLYGPQPFARDYWGIAGKNSKQIDGTHKTDWRLWSHIDPFVDFYVASIYVFYDRPDSVFYMAANIEENYQRTRKLGNKPVYAYEWLRYHASNRWQGNRELDPYLVEAVAIIPYFSGARGIVLWGYEKRIKGGRAYERLPLYMKNLKRVARLSGKIGHAELIIDEPAHLLWQQKRPLVRRLIVKPGECIIMALNPWQGHGQTSQTQIRCGEETYHLSMQGRHTTIALLAGGKVREY